MTAGVHCAHFEMRKLGNCPCVGVVGPGFDPAAGGNPGLMNDHNSVGWLMDAHDGGLIHGGGKSAWPGQGDEIEEGDVVVGPPPCAVLLRGCAEGLVCACRLWCSTSTPAGELCHRMSLNALAPLTVTSARSA